MRLRLRIHGGSLHGRGFEFEGGPVRVGRQPGLELSFHPEEDRSVSARHAELLHASGGWGIRDLGSRNGTFVNGARLVPGEAGAHPLEDGDRITFGEGGPQATVELAGGTEARIRAAAGRHSRTLKTGLAAAVILLASTLTAVMVANRARTSDFAAERARLLEETDRALTELAALQAELDAGPPPEAGTEGDPGPAAPPPQGTGARAEGGGGDPAGSDAMAEALRRSERELRELRDALREPPGTREAQPSAPAETEELRRQLQEATAALRRQQLAGSLDLDAIQAGNRQAVALVFVETAGGAVVTGTAFGVRTDGTLLTVRHLIRTESGEPLPTRIAVQFSDSPQVWPARLVAESQEVDLAAIRVENIEGAIPVVRGLNSRPDTLGTGIPVASLGFPLGGGVEGSGGIARPLVTAGVLSVLGPVQIQVHGYGDVGASGSPVFDAAGEVVGVLFGGFTQGSDQVLVAVNSVQAMRFLGRIPLGR